MDRIRSIVVATDFSPLSEAAAVRAAMLAGLDGATIHLVHALRFPLVASPYDVSVPAAVWEGVRQGAHEKLERAKKAVEESGVESVSAEIADTPDPVKAIAAAVAACSADLVVIGTHGHGGIKHAFLGSVAESTLRSVDVPVLAVKEDAAAAAQPIRRILVAVDFSSHSDYAVEVAAALATRLSASLDIVHVLDVSRYVTPYAAPFAVELEEKIRASAAEQLDGIAARLGKNQVEATTHLRRGRPSLAIQETAEQTECQLIVMGTRGNSGLSHVLLGSVAERTLRVAPCSVLAVKASDGAANA